MVPPFLGSHLSGTYPKSRLIGSDDSSSSTKTHSTNIAAIFYLCVAILNGVCNEEKKKVKENSCFVLITLKIYPFTITASVML